MHRSNLNSQCPNCLTHLPDPSQVLGFSLLEPIPHLGFAKFVPDTEKLRTVILGAFFGIRQYRTE